MARKAKTEPVAPQEISQEPVNLGALLSSKRIFQPFKLWIVGDTPLITHAWSHKAKLEMLQKQVGATRAGKEKRDPEADFVSSLYEMGDGPDDGYGFPATGIKNCILSAAHKDKGVARSSVLSALWIDAQMVRTRPALSSAICDMPLVRIWSGDPEKREDMVKIGSGLNKIANLAYRGQFSIWAMRITGRFNPAAFSADALAFLVQESGIASGLGEWRNERRGMFGSFHLASAEEESQWEDFSAGRGSLPVPDSYRMAAE